MFLGTFTEWLQNEPKSGPGAVPDTFQRPGPQSQAKVDQQGPQNDPKRGPIIFYADRSTRLSIGHRQAD